MRIYYKNPTLLYDRICCGSSYTYPRENPVDYLWKKRRSTFHIPFYMDFIKYADKYKLHKLNTKFNRNIRPKSTHSAFRFYR